MSCVASLSANPGKKGGGGLPCMFHVPHSTLNEGGRLDTGTTGTAGLRPVRSLADRGSGA